MSIKFLVLGGGVFWVWRGGSADFILWARGFFSEKMLRIANLVIRYPGPEKNLARPPPHPPKNPQFAADILDNPPPPSCNFQ